MRKRDIARYIMDALPDSSGPDGAMPADQLALLFLLEAEGGITIGAIVAALGRSQAATSALVDRAEGLGRVHRSVDPADRRQTLVHLGARALQEAARSRGGRRVEPYVEGGKPRDAGLHRLAIGPKRVVVEAGGRAGSVDRLECGHLFVITNDDRRIAGSRFCHECKEGTPE